MHALAEFGQLRGGALTAKQVAAEFGLQLLDGSRQRRLRDVALVGGAREVEYTRDREKYRTDASPWSCPGQWCGERTRSRRPATP